MTALEHIRRRSRAVAWALLPLLAVAWLNGAAACVGMQLGDDAGAELGRAVETRHDHALHDPADHGPHNTMHSHAHDGPDDSATLPAAPLHDHGDCPHCPTSPATGELESGHAFCSVSDGAAAAATANTAAQWDLKPFLSPIAWIEPVAATPPVQMRIAPVQAAAVPHPRSLNVRYCVLLL